MAKITIITTYNQAPTPVLTQINKKFYDRLRFVLHFECARGNHGVGTI